MKGEHPIGTLGESLFLLKCFSVCACVYVREREREADILIIAE